MNATIATTMTYKQPLTSQPCNHTCESLENQTGSRAGAKKEQGIKAELREEQHKGAWWTEVGSEICCAGKARKSAAALLGWAIPQELLSPVLSPAKWLFGFPGLMLDTNHHFSCLLIAGCHLMRGCQQPPLIAPGFRCWRRLCLWRKHIPGPGEASGWAPVHSICVRTSDSPVLNTTVLQSLIM